LTENFISKRSFRYYEILEALSSINFLGRCTGFVHFAVTPHFAPCPRRAIIGAFYSHFKGYAMPSTLSRAPGFYDRLADESASAAGVTATLQQIMTRFGYQAIETPIVEYADLFLTKSGDESANRLFNFEIHGRQLCLRPEFTASAARLYVERFQHEPKPIRWQCTGPVFRYESPQRSHSRQFTMLGVELIGPSGVAGDAEAMGLAARGLSAVGLTEWTLVIGHVGLVNALLENFDLDRRIHRFVLGQIENLRRPDRGRAYVEQQFAEMYTGLPTQPSETENIAEQVVAIDDESDLGKALEMLLESANLGTTGTGRSNEDVARRLLRKRRRAGQQPELKRALDFLETLTSIEGSPDESFPKLEALLPNNPAIKAMAADFRAAVEMLPAYGVAPERIRLHMGLARGLNYYTGIVFEAHTHEGDSASQLVGGGRYDDLIRVLGAGHDTPAIGFAYGLERILTELYRIMPPTAGPETLALVVPVEDSDNLHAVKVAMRLREEFQINTEVFTPPTRNLSSALSHAVKRGTPYVIITGQVERNTGTITVRNMGTGEQTTLPETELGAFVSKLRAG
jgi:histidyl-tRNA synthetase